MPVTEAEKVFLRIKPLLEGKSVVDLGCGIKKIAPWAIGVDDESESRVFWDQYVKARVDSVSGDLSKSFTPDSFDVVFSSHTLEHIRYPLLDTIRYWVSFVKPGGRLILYLPDENRYRFDPGNPKVKNPGHAHILTPQMFRELLDQVKELSLEHFEEDPQIYDHYSFLVVCRKAAL